MPWWNDECDKSLKESKRAYRLYKKEKRKAEYYQKSPNRLEDLQNLQESLKIDYKRKRANARRIFKESRKKSWESFITSINSYTPPGIVWQKINAINGQKKQKTNNSLKKQ